MPIDLSKLPDRDLHANLKNYNTATTATPADFGITAADVTALGADLDEFETAMGKWDAVQDTYDAKLQAKNVARQNLLNRGRAQKKLTRDKQGITGENLALAGLEPYDTTKTPSPSPDGVPVAIIDFGKLRHTINFRHSKTIDTDKKPDGMLGAEIWMKIGGDAPVDNTGCEYLATDTATPYLKTFTGADAGKTAWYLLRWVSKNGDKGDWSEAVAATING